MLFAERVEERVHGVEHGHHLHGGDVAADPCKAHHIAEEDRNIWEHLLIGQEEQPSQDNHAKFLLILYNVH